MNNTPAIRAEGLVKHFGEVVALDGLDLEAATGSVLGLLGPNGAGKTTAVRILTTVLRPDAGRAHVLGLDVVADADEVRPLIGLAGQFAAVDENLTGRENLRMVGRLAQVPRDVARQRAVELLERFDLSDAADRPAKTYSGGMRRRLDVAAALVHNPPVLFFDEPTTGLDPASRNALWDLIDDLVESGATVLLTTQYMDEADRLADRIVIIDQGRAIAEGTPSELKDRMGASALLIGLDDAATAKQAADLLADLVESPPAVERNSVLLAVADGAALVPEVMRRLDRNELTPKTLSLRQPSLDDVFLTLTGHKAHAEDGDAGQPEAAPTPTGGAR